MLGLVECRYYFSSTCTQIDRGARDAVHSQVMKLGWPEHNQINMPSQIIRHWLVLRKFADD